MPLATITVNRPAPVTTEQVPLDIETKVVQVSATKMQVEYWAEFEADSLPVTYRSNAIALGTAGDLYSFQITATPQGGSPVIHQVIYEQLASDTLTTLLSRLAAEAALFQFIADAKVTLDQKLELTGRPGVTMAVADDNSTTPTTWTNETPTAPGAGVPVRGLLGTCSIDLAFTSTGLQEMIVEGGFFNAATPPVAQPGAAVRQLARPSSTQTIGAIMTALGL